MNDHDHGTPDHGSTERHHFGDATQHRVVPDPEHEESIEDELDGTEDFLPVAEPTSGPAPAP